MSLRGLLRGVLVVMAVIAVMLVLSPVYGGLRHPVVILVVALGTLGLMLAKDRRTAVRIGVAGSIALAFVLWAAAQPSYGPVD